MAGSTLAPLANRDYRLLLAGFAISQMLMPLQFITQILWVQQFAPRDIWLILVAGIAASRGLGALAFGLYGGALADRFDRRKLLLWLQLLQIVGTLIISALMYSSAGEMWGYMAFFALTFLTSGLQAVDGPTRLAIVPDVLGMELTAAGLSLNQVAGQVVIPIAMMMTGILIDQLGFAGAYLCNIVGNVIAIVCIYRMHYQPDESQHLRTGTRYGFGEAFRDVRTGLGWARRHPVIFWLIMLLVLMMGLGYPATASLGPTWITTVVKVEIRDMGFVVMFWGIGALLGAVTMARLASYERRGLLIALGTLLYAAAFVIFAGDHTRLNAIIGNIGLGAGMTTTMVSSTILIQHLTPNEMRGRIMSLLQLNMAFAQLMTMPVAMLAQWLTLPVLFPVLSYLTLGVVVLILATQLQLVRTRIPAG